MMSEPILYRGKQFIPVPEAARKSNLSANYIATMARENRIDSIARGDRILVAEDDLDKIEAKNPFGSRGGENNQEREADRPMPGQTDYFYRPVSTQKDKVVAILAALLFSGGVYTIGTTNAPGRLAAGFAYTTDRFAQSAEIVSSEIGRKVRNEGIDDLLVDSVVYTAGRAVESFSNGAALTENMTAGAIRAIEF